MTEIFWIKRGAGSVLPRFDHQSLPLIPPDVTLAEKVAPARLDGVEWPRMDYLKLIQRLCLIFSVMLLIGIVVRLFLPLIGHQKELRAREAELRLEIQQEAEALRMLRLKQERLQEDPRFVEKIAREKLGYAKPGETIFRFVDDDAP